LHPIDYWVLLMEAAADEDSSIEQAVVIERPVAEVEEQSAQDRVLGALDRVLDEWCVTGMHRAGAQSFIKKKIIEGEECARVRQWMLLRMNKRVWDHGLPICRVAENIPNLRSMQVWPREDLPWLSKIEAHFAEIRAELLAARDADNRSGFQPYRDPAHKGAEDRVPADGLGVEGVDSGAWNVLYLHLNHKRFEDNCARFPATLRAIEQAFPRHYSHAFFSALTPGSHIVKHHGPSNRMLRTWLPICGLDGFRLRVGEEIVQPKEGQAFAWDHSYEHEAWHDGCETRVVLIVDVWHPDLTDPEVKFLGTLQNCRLRAGRALAEAAAEEGIAGDELTHFDIIEKARGLLTDDEWWIIRAERDPTIKPT